MIHALTCPRSPHYYRALMLKLLAVAGVTFILWQPLAPVRYVTADLLSFAADQVRR
jgi:hypothetical protein